MGTHHFGVCFNAPHTLSSTRALHLRERDSNTALGDFEERNTLKINELVHTFIIALYSLHLWVFSSANREALDHDKT